MKKILIILLISLLTLSGCWDKSEPEDLAIVIGGGVDYNPETKRYKVIAQFINPQTMQTLTQGGGTEAPNYWTISSWGITPVDAITTASRKVTRQISYSHAQVMILSETFAREKGITPILDSMTRTLQSRPTIYLAVGKGDIEKILQVNFVIESHNAQALRNLITITNFELGIKSGQNARAFLTDLSLPGIEPIAIAYELLEEEEKKAQPDSEPPVRLFGLAAFKGDKMVGWLDERETRGRSWIMGTVDSTTINIKQPGSEDDYISVQVTQSDSKIEPKLENGKPVIQLQIKTDAKLNNITQSLDNKINEEFLTVLSRRVAEVIRNDIKLAVTKAQTLKTDVLGFGNAFYRLKYKDWLKIRENWDEHFCNLKVEIDVRTAVRRTGLIKEVTKSH